MMPELNATFSKTRELPQSRRENKALPAESERSHLVRLRTVRVLRAIFPCLNALAGVHLIGNRHYFRPYAWLDRGDENRDDKGGHALRKRPWGREGPGSSRMPHEPFCPSRAVCSGKSSATSTRRRSLKN